MLNILKVVLLAVREISSLIDLHFDLNNSKITCNFTT